MSECLEIQGANLSSLLENYSIPSFAESLFEFSQGNPGPLTADLFEVFSSRIKPTPKSSYSSSR